MYEGLCNKEKTIAVVGLGYVGLPLALELAQHFQVLGFDISPRRVALMQQGHDPSQHLEPEAFQEKQIEFTADPERLHAAHFYIVAVPTAVDDHKVPDLAPLRLASQTIGQVLKKGDYVVFESTTYPGCTEEECVPILEKTSGLRLHHDFKIGYSPERINPGDRKKSVAEILKIVAASDSEALEQIAKVYGHIIHAGIYRAPSIRVAEAAKVIENTQRDLNISLMNELSILFDRLGLDTREVLDAAATKWNFQRFTPGLVGGHCIAVDPYYLLHKARQVGYDPQVILSGRRVNDGMPAYIAKKLVQALIAQGKTVQHSRVLIMGITFKENVADIRNSKVADLAKELAEYKVCVHLSDPLACTQSVQREYGLTLQAEIGKDYDAVVVAVAHDPYRGLRPDYFRSLTTDHPVLFDLKAIYNKNEFAPEFHYWRL